MQKDGSYNEIHEQEQFIYMFLMYIHSDVFVFFFKAFTIWTHLISWIPLNSSIISGICIKFTCLHEKTGNLSMFTTWFPINTPDSEILVRENKSYNLRHWSSHKLDHKISHESTSIKVYIASINHEWDIYSPYLYSNQYTMFDNDSPGTCRKAGICWRSNLYQLKETSPEIIV